MKKRVFSLLMIFMMVSMLLTVRAADSATASTIRLEMTEGTVTITNKNGKSVSVREGAKLYNGYTIKTSAASYAYISLDADKIIKLDASTIVEVRQSGKNLEVALQIGKLFFNVTKPLSGDETLNIRTSTMVTGIRGTSGVISATYVDGIPQSSLILLTGTVDVQTGTQQHRVTAGETLTATGREETPLDIDVLLETLTVDAIRGFVAIEIAKQPNLQSEIEAQTLLDLQDIIDNADKLLAEDERLAAEELERLHHLLEEDAALLAALSKVVVNPLFNQSKESPGKNNGTGAAGGIILGVPGPVAPAPAPNPSGAEYVLAGTALTEADFLAALSAGHTFITVPVGAVMTIGSGKSVIIPSGVTLQILGTLDIASGSILYNASNTTFITRGTAQLLGFGTIVNGYDAAIASNATLIPQMTPPRATPNGTPAGSMQLYGGGGTDISLVNLVGTVTFHADAPISINSFENFDTVVMKSGANVTATNLVAQYAGSFMQEAGATLNAIVLKSSDGGTLEQQGTINFTDTAYSYAPYTLFNTSAVIGAGAQINLPYATAITSTDGILYAENSILNLSTGAFTAPADTTRLVLRDTALTINGASISMPSNFTSPFINLGSLGGGPISSTISNSTLNLGTSYINVSQDAPLTVTSTTVSTSSADGAAYKLNGGALTLTGGTHGGVTMADGGGNLIINGNAAITGTNTAIATSPTGTDTISITNATIKTTSSASNSYLIDVKNQANVTIGNGANLTKTGDGAVFNFASSVSNMSNTSIALGALVSARGGAKLVGTPGFSSMDVSNHRLSQEAPITNLGDFTFGAVAAGVVEANVDNENGGTTYEYLFASDNFGTWLSQFTAAETVRFIANTYTPLLPACTINADITADLSGTQVLNTEAAVPITVNGTLEITSTPVATFGLNGTLSGNGSVSIGNQCTLSISTTDGSVSNSVSVAMQSGSALSDISNNTFYFGTQGRTLTHGEAHGVEYGSGTGSYNITR